MRVRVKLGMAPGIGVVLRVPSNEPLAVPIL